MVEKSSQQTQYPVVHTDDRGSAAVTTTFDPDLVEWTKRALDLAQKAVGLTPRLHDPADLMGRGDIFLFNHFARFETLFPPLFIYRQTGVLARSIAHQELFTSALGGTLSGLGAVPHDMPGLIPFLAAEILRGRKVVLFPEGGMVKDLKVQDEDGAWRVYSPTAGLHRPHHSGAAVLALLVDACKERIRSLARAGKQDVLDRWGAILGIASTDLLLERASQPTLLVPGYITFYPLQPPESWMVRGIDLFTRWRGLKLPAKIREELLVEGSMLWRDTDMDIRLGNPLPAREQWTVWERLLINHSFSQIDSLEAFFDLTQRPDQWASKVARLAIRHWAHRLRDQWAGRLYRLMTLNLSHLVGTACVVLAERGKRRLSRSLLGQVLVLALDRLRQSDAVYLHPSLAEAWRTDPLWQTKGDDLSKILQAAYELGLVMWEGETLILLPSFQTKVDVDTIRLSNPLCLAANQASAVPEVRAAISAALALLSPQLDGDQDPPLNGQQAFAKALLNQDILAVDQGRKRFRQAPYATLTAKETATEDAHPFLLLPRSVPSLSVVEPVPLGVLLIHGFLASPAEMRDLGMLFHQQGYAVMGVRLAGHGTSPWDLRGRPWQEWFDSLRRGWAILAPYCEKILMVGFSTGGALAAMHAARQPDRLAGLVSVAAPLRFVDRRMMLVPWLRHLDEATRWRPGGSGDGLAFRPNHSEHPSVNYAHIPLDALAELMEFTQQLPQTLPQVRCPALVIQGTKDPVVAPESAQVFYDCLGSKDKRLHWVPSQRHGLIYDRIGDTVEQIVGFARWIARP